MQNNMITRPGDHVVLHWRKSQGIESAPPRYTWKGQQVNAGLITTFNEYAIVSEKYPCALTPPENNEPWVLEVIAV